MNSYTVVRKPVVKVALVNHFDNAEASGRQDVT
jgi:hypothetical protein